MIFHGYARYGYIVLKLLDKYNYFIHFSHIQKLFTFTVQSVKIFLCAPHLPMQHPCPRAAVPDGVCGVIQTS